MDYITVCGLEVHTELATKTKIFCNCTTEFGGEPNTHVCEICSGMPGTLPVVNKRVVEFAVRTGLALNCEITQYNKFDRKNYFYPDLPKAYQISQLYLPICRNGWVEINDSINGGKKKVRIHEIHMEEDAGKLVHDEWTDSTLVNYNRCGVPLLEIVSEPDIASADEAVEYVEKLRAILQFCGVSSFSTQTSYENQTKKAITNKFIQDAMTDFFRKQLEVYFIENKMDADKIADQVLINMRSRIKAEKTRKTLKTTLQTKVDMTNRIQKFVDCRSKDVNEREIFIVEGDSALGACKQARDANFQAIMPVRGKILNCLKSDYDKIFKSEIITDLIKVLGCGVEVKSKAAKDVSMFDMEALRWNKIMICTDADVDGFQIRTLILTMIYRLMPRLIEEGKVYIAESPLYEVTCKDQTYFAYNEIEMDEIKAELGDSKYTVQRSKGLGENEADMMSLTTMNPATRRLIKVTPSDALATSEMFDLLLGDNLEGRKNYIADYGHLYLDAADVS